MNRLDGTIVKVSTHGHLSMVDIDVSGENFKAIVIDTPDSLPFLVINNPISVLFKETEVVIGKKGEHYISLRNRLFCRISEIEEGSLLSKLTLLHAAGEIRSIITTHAVRHLELKVDEEVWAMIKTNEVMITE